MNLSEYAVNIIQVLLVTLVTRYLTLKEVRKREDFLSSVLEQLEQARTLAESQRAPETAGILRRILTILRIRYAKRIRARRV